MPAVTEHETPPSLSKARPTQPLGKQFEDDFFGLNHESGFHHLSVPKIQSLKEASLRNYCNKPFQTVMYGFNPSNPGTFMSSLVFEKIKDSLLPTDRPKLRMYCLVGTRADQLGVDCVIQLEGEPKKRALIDLTTDPGKIVSSSEIIILYRYYFRALLGENPNFVPLTEFVQRVVDRLHPR